LGEGERENGGGVGQQRGELFDLACQALIVGLGALGRFTSNLLDLLGSIGATNQQRDCR
jgi:hypothetical protein